VLGDRLGVNAAKAGVHLVTQVDNVGAGVRISTSLIVAAPAPNMASAMTRSSPS
jgi:hypothetical protein